MAGHPVYVRELVQMGETPPLVSEVLGAREQERTVRVLPRWGDSGKLPSLQLVPEIRGGLGSPQDQVLHLRIWLIPGYPAYLDVQISARLTRPIGEL